MNIILLSNASADYFPNNTLSSFKVQLPRRLRLQGPHEVGLLELIYPAAYNNVDEGSMCMAITMMKPGAPDEYTHNDGPDAKVTELFEAGRTFEEISAEFGATSFYFPPGSYMDENEVLRMFDANKMTRGVRLKYRHDKKRFALKWTRPVEGPIRLCAGLARFLGFGNGLYPVNVKTEGAAPYEPALTGGLNTMFVYTDIMEHQQVGGTVAQLLRIIVPDTSQSGAMRSERYIKPYYHPLCKSTIDTISIEIKTIEGKPFPFVSGSGTVIVKLHIRPQRLL